MLSLVPRTVVGRRLAVLLLLGLTIVAFCAVPIMAQDAAAAAAPAADEHASADGESMLMWIARCSGLIGAFILALSVYFLATVIQLFIEVRESEVAPKELVENCEGLIEQRNFRQALQSTREDDSPLGQILAAGITELPHGIAEAREAMEKTNESLTTQMEKRISILAVLGTLGPMIGLLGTLKGMIGAFGEISRSGATMKPQAVAGHISEALLLTFEGVALSVPAIYFFSFFRNRILALSVNMELTADGILRKLYHASRTKPGPAAAPAAAATS